MKKDKTIRFLGIPFYKSREKNGVRKQYICGLPFYQRKIKNNIRKKYIFGICYNKQKISPKTTSNLKTNIIAKLTKNQSSAKKEVFNLSPYELNIGIKLEGGFGDFLISANYLYLLRKIIGYEKIRIDVFGPNKESLLTALFKEDGVVNHAYSVLDVGLEDTKYDLLLLLLRKPVVLHAKRNKIYEYSPELFNLVQKYEATNVKERRLFLRRPFCDGQNVSISLIKKTKRYQEPDIDKIINMTEEFDYPLFIDEDEDKYLAEYDLKGKKYISVHRGVDQRATKDSVKQWPVIYYNILIEKIKKVYPDIKIVQLGFSKDRCPKFDNIDIDLIGRTSLEQVKVILKNSALHIDGEGGMVHLRHALKGGKSLVLFGATSPEFYGYSENINLRGTGCSHWCEWLTENWQAKCARGFDRPPCIYSLTPEIVFNEFNEIWSSYND